MRYVAEDIDNLINQLKIEEVVGEVIELKKAGANYKGLCPFHQDTSPSFSVSPSKNICKCFVCGAGGNPITFYSQYYKVSFEQAVEELSKKYNIPVRSYGANKKVDNQNNKYYKIMQEAHKFFQDQIFENEGRIALEYLSNRGVHPKFIKESGIGYSLNAWSELYDYLITKGFNKDDILALGLVKEGDKGVYDTFRNRIMFPIYSPQGQIIAFGGRTLEKGKEVPKYINSPDTPIFKKGKNLYGIRDRGNVLRKKNYSILMEGYMDVLSAQRYGFDVALASLGTAFTLEQGKLLKRYTNNVILALDMDKAGQVATEKTAFILKNLGFNIRVLKYTGAKDPDEFLKKFGKDEFLKEVKKSLEIFDFLYEFYLQEYDLSNVMSKEKFIERFKEFFKNVESKLEKTLYLDRLSKATGISKDILKNTLIDNNNFRELKSNTYDLKEAVNDEKLKSNKLETDTLKLILADFRYYKYFKNKKIENELIKKIFEIFENFKDEEFKIYDLKEQLNVKDFSEEEKMKILNLNLEVISRYTDIKNREKDLIETFKSWFREELKESKMNRNNLLLFIELKKIEVEIPYITKFEDVLEKYKKFREVLQRNQKV